MAEARSEVRSIKNALNIRRELRSSSGTAPILPSYAYSAVPPPISLMASSWPAAFAPEAALPACVSPRLNSFSVGSTDLPNALLVRVLEFYAGLPASLAVRHGSVLALMKCTTKAMAVNWSFTQGSITSNARIVADAALTSVDAEPDRQRVRPQSKSQQSRQQQQQQESVPRRRALSHSSPANPLPMTGFGISTAPPRSETERLRQVERDQLNALIAAILSVGLKRSHYIATAAAPGSGGNCSGCLHVNLSMRFQPRADGGLDAVFKCEKCGCGVSTAAANVGAPLRRTKFWCRLTDEAFIASLLRFFKQA